MNALINWGVWHKSAQNSRDEFKEPTDHLVGDTRTPTTTGDKKCKWQTAFEPRAWPHPDQSSTEAPVLVHSSRDLCQS
jgi:hypothetical protein